LVESIFQRLISIGVISQESNSIDDDDDDAIVNGCSGHGFSLEYV
jgi:hypothetical protein